MAKKRVREENTEEPDATANNYKLKLFITGATPNSLRAVANLKEICDEHLSGKYSLEIIDVYQQQSVAETEQLIALPLLLKLHPLPIRKLIGDLSNTGKVLTSLGLQD